MTATSPEVGRHGRQPQQAHAGAEQQHDGGRGRDDQEEREQHRAPGVDAAQQQPLAVRPAEHAGGVGADHVEQPDQRERPGGERAAEAEVGQVRAAGAW
jgi:hypothetical protein